jgi:hypothetical protein
MNFFISIDSEVIGRLWQFNFACPEIAAIFIGTWHIHKKDEKNNAEKSHRNKSHIVIDGIIIDYKFSTKINRISLKLK